MTAPSASQAPAVKAVFFTVTYIEVVPPSAAQGAIVVRQYGDASRKERGAGRFQTLQRLDRPNQFVVLAAWRDQDAYETHVGSTHHKRFTQELASVLAAPSDTRQHVGLAVGDVKASGASSITVVTHVDVVPQYKDDCVVAIQQLAADSRKQDGNRRFDVWQQTNRPNHFTVVETWSSRRRFNAHAMAAETRDFRTKLAVMAGALYDERLYRTIL